MPRVIEFVNRRASKNKMFFFLTSDDFNFSPEEDATDINPDGGMSPMTKIGDSHSLTRGGKAHNIIYSLAAISIKNTRL